MRAAALAIGVLLAVARGAAADDGDDLAAAVARAALDEVEAIAARRPVTRWTDNAYAEAARLAERAGDFARARANLAQVAAIGTDAALVERARAALARLAAATGGGRWDEVARTHERLLREANAGGDPREALEALEALARAEPAYPRAAVLHLGIARGWEREGAGGRAIARLEHALAAAAPAGTDRTWLGLELARLQIRQRALADAAALLDRLAAEPRADRAAIDEVRALLATAELRARLRAALWIGLAALAAAAAALLRRDAGSWRAAGRRLARPPGEVLFLLPIAAVIAVVARTGNPLVADAVAAILAVGLGAGWISGALLDAARARRGTVGAPRVIAQAALAVAAILGASYLAVDRDRMIDLVVETWRHGPQAP